ncbi:hypothetical protein BVY03_04180, partial [bacterium K02(2017)]
MNFFEHQRQSYTNTKWLIFFFAIAVFLTILAIYLACGFCFTEYWKHQNQDPPFIWWNIKTFFIFGLPLTLIILCATFYKIFTLKKGGKAIAELLNAKKISSDSKNLNEKQFYNVVEEMAIASGVPVPEVYLLEKELGLNALAAGYDIDDAIICVTNGALDCFTREELQGVIAHEFSHVFNGDMRLNLYLIGILHGIMVVGEIGRFLMRASSGRRNSYGGMSNSKKGSSGHLFLIGLLIYLIGSIGVFFGKIIKAAVSRQREYLADASSVQFTRNPTGISNVLKKIGGQDYNSYVGNRYAEQCGHMFFAECLHPSWLQTFATHPPLAKRIKRVEPSWDGKFIPVTFQNKKMEFKIPKFTGHQQENKLKNKEMAVDKIVDLVGTMSMASLDAARSTLKMIPENLMKYVHSSKNAPLVIYAFLLEIDSLLQQKQLKILNNELKDEEFKILQKIIPFKNLFMGKNRLAIIDLLIPSLKSLEKS